MTRLTAATFDLCGPLPEGTTVLEASAGTGKTHTIAGLACRYLAEGIARIDELMLVTFGRAATAELRERVRERLTAVTGALGDVDTGRSSEDDLVRHLATGDDADVIQRHARLATALADFDAATIATTHGFCHQMLAGLGIAADLDHDVTFAESTGDLVVDVATDLYVGDFGRDDSPQPGNQFDFATAAGVARRAVEDPAARLEPEQAAGATDADDRLRFAERAREEVARRKRVMRVMDYDDLLTYLRDALTHPQSGEDARSRIRARYKIVLVDEFQDTDPVQWDILERTFHGHRTLVLIGDPKQAIYAFRGADVVTYLAATEVADAGRTLGRNWRSDWPLVAGLRHLFGNAALGDPRIVVHDVDAAHAEASLLGAPVTAPVRLRRVPRSEFGTESSGRIAVRDARPFVACDVATDIVRLLSSGAQVVERNGRQRRLEASDIAVLVHRNDDGAAVRDALAKVHVPVVLTATASVFASDAAQQWLALLSALEQPQRSGLSRNVALTDFVGWTAERLATATEEELDNLVARLRGWSETLTGRGVAALLEAATSTGLTRRVLAREGGERDLTDLRHVGQALHRVAVEGNGGISVVVQWLQRRMAEAANDIDEERSRRLDSDAKAVQVMTIWRSKGLEFPVVYAPFLWDRWVPDQPDPLRMHDKAGRRVLDVGGPSGPGYSERLATHLREEAGESLRLAYVALTRARCQVVAHWVPGSTTPNSSLHRLLFGDVGVGVVPDRVRVPDETAVRSRLDALAARSGGLVVVEAATAAATNPLVAPSTAATDLSVRSFGRDLDRVWMRTSYTGITSGLHEAAAATAGTSASEPDDPGVLDEPGTAGEVDTSASTGAARFFVPDAAELVSPMAELPVGAAFGTLVHAVLERTDFTSEDVAGGLRSAAEVEGSARFAGVEPVRLADALVPALQTPLGPLAAGLRLADIPRRDRLDELEFELPLAGGDTPTGEVPVARVAGLLRRHLAPEDPLHGYADDLDIRLMAERRLRGFLTGSIDLVLRVRGEDQPPAGRFLVVDYKTNWLGPAPGSGQPLTSEQYRPETMATAMRHAHYPLQALLYSVALHRYLRWRLPGYDPAVHLGGVLYLFLRGMCGADTPAVNGTPHGVFAWSPPPQLVIDVSDVLKGNAS
jgi:exodeoxyribonuclease V beta subunit